jgi:hypothetical protein
MHSCVGSTTRYSTHIIALPALGTFAQPILFGGQQLSLIALGRRQWMSLLPMDKSFPGFINHFVANVRL